MEMTIRFEFTAAVHQALKGQSRPALRFPSDPRLISALSNAQIGDSMRIEGMPTSTALCVVGRSWTVMSDELRLLLVLGLGTAEAPSGDSGE